MNVEANYVPVKPRRPSIPKRPGDWAVVDSQVPELNLLAAIIHQAVVDLSNKKRAQRLSAGAMLRCSFVTEWNRDMGLIEILKSQEERKAKHGKGGVVRHNRLKEIRLEYGITQQEISVKGQIGGGTLVAIERYNLYPSEETREKLTATLTDLTGRTICQKDIFPEEAEIGGVW